MIADFVIADFMIADFMIADFMIADFMIADFVIADFMIADFMIADFMIADFVIAPFIIAALLSRVSLYAEQRVTTAYFIWFLSFCQEVFPAFPAPNKFYAKSIQITGKERRL